MEEFEALLEGMIKDDKLTNAERIEILYDWKAKIIDSNSNRIMSKEAAGKHLAMLGIIDASIRLCS